MKVKNKKICLITLGCSKNLVDSEVILGGIKNSDYEVTDDAKDADTIIVTAWNYKDHILNKSNNIFKKGTKLIFPLPDFDVQIVN